MSCAITPDNREDDSVAIVEAVDEFWSWKDATEEAFRAEDNAIRPFVANGDIRGGAGIVMEVSAAGRRGL
jgi:hypothetical protein